ncbi:MAG: DUF1934 domain-containing protein [Lachnospiraceae bacterium]|nr:DUF1934 domain-containing protein [Lachnospiraceae bacterium]
MKQNAWIRICGEHYVDGQWMEPVITETRGRYIFRNGAHYLQYSESGAQEEDAAESLIRFTDSMLRVNKKGSVLSELLFIPGKTTAGSFGGGTGVLTMEMRTDQLVLVEKEELIEISAEYAMLAGGSEAQKSRVRITVIPEGGTEWEHSV